MLQFLGWALWQVAQGVMLLAVICLVVAGVLGSLWTIPVAGPFLLAVALLAGIAIWAWDRWQNFTNNRRS